MVSKYKMATSRTGAISELAATVWLMKNGYEVFRNVSPTGKVDLIVEKAGALIKIDVKTASLYKGKINLKAAKNEHLGISYLYVLPDGNCMWRKDVEDARMFTRTAAEWADEQRSRIAEAKLKAIGKPD